MRLSVNGLVPSRLRTLKAARICVIGALGAGLSACASSSTPNYAGVYQAPPAPIPQRASERQWKVEIEEDGKPAQAPPVRRMRPEEDDPSQPWSPNYGKPPSEWQRPAAPAPLPRTAWPQPIETSIKTAAVDGTSRVAPAPARPSRPLGQAEADALVTRAIQNHEIRRP
jgi:hypothetical protein